MAEERPVYVVVEGFSYEGIQTLIGAYATREVAESIRASLAASATHGAYWYEIKEVPFSA